MFAPLPPQLCAGNGWTLNSGVRAWASTCCPHGMSLVEMIGEMIGCFSLQAQETLWFICKKQVVCVAGH